jgi:thioredoxin 2
VLVDFNAEWCGPCHVMAPIVEQLAGELAGRLKVVKVDVDRAPASAARYGVRSIPTMVLLWQGEERGRLIGAQPAGTLRAWLEERLTTLGQGTEVRK